MNRSTNIQTDRQVNLDQDAVRLGGSTDASMHTYLYTDRQMHRQTEGQTDRQTNRYLGRQTI